MESIITAVIIVAAIGLIAGLGLAVASIAFAVPVDEKAEAIRECLPGANCGACGFSGCDGYAAALSSGEATDTTLCSPGGNDAAKAIAEVLGVSAGDVNALTDEYYSKYEIALEGRDADEFRRHVAVQAQIEIGMEKFLEEGNYQAFVTHFGMLGGLKQLPGLAVQRLMEKGYGFGGEGDWKTAAMVRLMKIMTQGVKNAKGTSFMEDYTYNFVKGKEECCKTV